MPKVKVLRVVSKSASFRRAGRQFSSETTDIPLADLSKEDREAIESDKCLVAYETEAEVPEPDGEKEAKNNKTKK